MNAIVFALVAAYAATVAVGMPAAGNICTSISLIECIIFFLLAFALSD